MRPQPWHDEARKLVELGVSKSAVARKVGKDRKRVEMLFNLDYKARQSAYQKRYREERLASDPGYRDQERTRRLRARIRRQARAEAAEQNLPVEQIYERWGVA